MSEEELAAVTVAIGGFLFAYPAIAGFLGLAAGTGLALNQARDDWQAFRDPDPAHTVSWWSPALKGLEFVGDWLYGWSQQEDYL